METLRRNRASGAFSRGAGGGAGRGSAQGGQAGGGGAHGGALGGAVGAALLSAQPVQLEQPAQPCAACGAPPEAAAAPLQRGEPSCAAHGGGAHGGGARGCAAQAAHPAGAFHFERPRLHGLFSQAAKCPLVVVCAGSGYGKTSAVRDFALKSGIPAVWVQLSEQDRVGQRFWENYTHAVARLNERFARALESLGFPDSVDKINRYFSLLDTLVSAKRRLIVVDDFHFVEGLPLVRFCERAVRNLPVGTSMVLISRSAPNINIADMVSAGRVSIVSEDDLRFSEDELGAYFEGLGMHAAPEGVREVMRDTEGWAFAINLIARSYGKAPGYTGYLGSAMRANIFRLMEAEAWAGTSEPLRMLLLRLSLIGHLSADLVERLAGSDAALLDELERQHAYVRRDDYAGAYLIQPLFLEFLAGKQGLLPEQARRETYAVAAAWCDRHGFRIDALSYHEKIGDYAAIVAIAYALPVQIPRDIARYVAAILDRAPGEAFDTVEFLAALHMRAYMCQGLWEKASELAVRYETRLLGLPAGSPAKCRTLSRLYNSWAFLRSLMCTTDGRYDFDRYIEKYRDCLSNCCPSGPMDPGRFPILSPGAWVNRSGSAAAGSLDEYVDAFGRMAALLAGCSNNSREAECELARGELKFFRGDMRGAELCATRALGLARRNGQFGIAHLALFYAMRIGAALGSHAKIEQALGEIKALLGEAEYTDRFASHDISLAWYCCTLGLPEKVPLWLRKGFSAYDHAGFIENFANQAKAWHCYATGNYPPLLSYIGEMRERESFLLGRIELLAMEACARYRMGEKPAALAALEEAHAAAAPNEVTMPFAELGKDMRTLTSWALKEPACSIPAHWLQHANRRAASYAKRQAHVISVYRMDNEMSADAVLSPREAQVLGDLSQGLSRAEIAAVRGLSVNTVKMVIGKVHAKMGTENLADLIRVAVERGMIRKK